VSRPKLTLRDKTGTAYDTLGGEALVFGGDEVYPTASVKAYQQRTIAPWGSAMRGQRPAPHLFAIPGNHDWYDGLVSFIRLFCQGRNPDGWQMHQRRSYFAVKLPHGWWLLGTDMQLESDIDEPQLSYFKELATQMNPGDRIILCLAEPAWLLTKIRPPDGRTYLENNLDVLEDQVFKDKQVSVFLAGDLHHYRRHANADGQQKIIAGGGGAFLHPTHIPRKDRDLPEGFLERACFPTPEESRRLSWQNLGLVASNPRFGVLTGVLYTLLAWALAVDIGTANVPKALGLVLSRAIASPGVVLISVLIVAGLIAFVDTRFGRWRWVAGLLHGLVHLAVAFLIAWGVAHLLGSALGLSFRNVGRYLLGAVLIFAGGFLAGPTIMGIYLLVALNVFSAHPNEGFSSLAIPDWKNFLRLHITPDGHLRIFPIGIRRVPRAWKPGATVRDPEWVADPKDTRATPPTLIEPPIVV